MSYIIPVILFSVFLKWSTGLFDYSGKGMPPLFGDYEAQRHWMEITLHLPMKEWYVQTEKNDLAYWGLDYPPLSAYHSLLMGYAANHSNPKYVALNESRGYESEDHKLFMRSTVLLSDLSTYIPGVLLHSFNNRNPKSGKSIVPDSYVLLMYPGLILIDYGHFQYNCVSLGFALVAYEALGAGFDVISCIFYCLSISYKQMLLYFSLSFFFYNLGKCRQAGKLNCVKRFIKISLTVILTFVLTWYPISKTQGQLLQVLNRIFPIYRGVFEDKVSNFWCLLNVIFKFRSHFSNEYLAIICAILTLITSLPSCINLFTRPSKQKFTLSLIISSLSFFLFSYHVHEKSIIIVALPVILYFRAESFHCCWFLIVSSCSMFPLLIKDGLVIPFISLHIIFIVTLDVFYNVFNYELVTKNNKMMHYIYYIFHVSMYSWAALLVSSLVFKPPEKYPDLFPLLISCYAALHFIYFFSYFNFVQLFKFNKKNL